MPLTDNGLRVAALGGAVLALGAAVGALEAGAPAAGSLCGIAVLLGLAGAISSSPRAIPLRTVGVGLALQAALALLILHTAAGRALFDALGAGFRQLIDLSYAGTGMLFGNLADREKGGTALAVQALPSIIFFGSLTAVLNYLGILPAIVRGMAWVMRRSMATGGAESLVAALNVFVGMVEAPLAVASSVRTMSRSELFSVMTTGMATIAGGVMAVYASFLQASVPNIAGHLLAASVMSAPAGLLVAKMMIPGTGSPAPEVGGGAADAAEGPRNVVDAATRGANDGLRLMLAVAGVLLAALAWVALANALLGLAGTNLTQVLRVPFWPLAVALGIPLGEASAAAGYLGEKTAVNEFVAYLHLSQALGAGESGLSARSVTILTYALCGFANFGSVAIMVTGISQMAPARTGEIAALGLRSLVSGTIAVFLTAAVVGVML
ncbi:MAG: hypothetical protein L0216_14315 [Planctomycetales bacterium]|nr:hypothetical protein [Planctomycetales bacterium]